MKKSLRNESVSREWIKDVLYLALLLGGIVALFWFDSFRLIRFYVLGGVGIGIIIGVITWGLGMIKRRWGESSRNFVILSMIVIWVGLGLWAGLTSSGRYYPPEYGCTMIGPWQVCD